ncbi:MAG: cytochrome P450 [Candidatus Nanopelagicales bacterium]|nr:cytochrome P450 [Candidatus Nanopelagicales bacterium]
MSAKKTPKRYGWNTPVTAIGPQGGAMLRNIKTITSDPLTYLELTWAEFGDVVQFPIPKPATYLVSSPEGAREVLVNQHNETSKRTLQYNNLSLVTGDGLLTADTQAWRPRRRMLQPAFHKEMIALSEHHIEAGLAKLDNQWRPLTSDGSAIIDIDHAMMSLALEITCGALFGIEVDDDVDEITSATLTALHGVVARARNPIALPLFFPTPANLKMKRAVKRLDKAVDAILVSRGLNKLPDQAPIRDMLDVLLDPDLETPLTKKQIRDEITTFIVAGHETVASALTWAWHLLVTNPDELQKLKEDPKRAQLVFDESLRLYPPAWVITRRTMNDITVDDVLIPANSLVIVSPWLVHRNPKAWANPNSFIPDRFQNGVPQVGYIPFGAGARLCIGKEMARLEGSQILAHIATTWNIEAIHTSPVPIDASVTLRPVSGMPVRISRLLD